VRLPTALLLAVLTLAYPPSAPGSQLIDRNASDVTLVVSAHNVALLTYRARGAVRQVLAWGAVGARAPSRRREQVAFRLDYRGRAPRAFTTRAARTTAPRLRGS
jgi:hypothetical protein